MTKRKPELIDARLVKALEHPIRVEILAILHEGPSSASRVSRQLENVSLNLVAHHMKRLKELGCVELVETVSRRGAREHIYRAMEPHVFSNQEWEALPATLRLPITAAILRNVSDDMARTLLAGCLEDLPNAHLSWSPLNLDEEGWSEVGDVLERALGEVLEVDRRSAKRIEASGEPSAPVRVAIMQFPVPAAEGDDLDQRRGSR